MIRSAIEKVVTREDLTEQEAVAVMEMIMAGEATPAQVAGFLTALRMKGETIQEITGFARVMRAKATRVDCRARPLVDTCGTGGDGRNTFNISTVSAFVAAGAGASIAKHGNRSASSRCGSADVLGALGVNIELPPERVAACIDTIGIGFLFAPLLHSSMRFAIGPRREIGIRTVFNMLGPLTNPAGATAQVMGVYAAHLVEPIAHVLNNLGVERAYVVHSEDGLDELTVTAPTRVAEVKEGHVTTFVVSPESLGLSLAPLQALHGGDAPENAAIARAVLQGENGPRRDVALLNAGAALVVAGIAADLREGIERARASIDTGAALAKLEALKQATQL
ncbi:MAG: anthranilate phosphoribosyltransferase [Candidatus Latescibacteria bacterium]|nr:anthranilate phosphoribosyltransferase [Candidatus Latescibacterota bacterium]